MPGPQVIFINISKIVTEDDKMKGIELLYIPYDYQLSHEMSCSTCLFLVFGMQQIHTGS